MTEKSKDLPIEVLDRIFQHLSQSHLLECQKVCRLWYPHVTRHLMNHVVLCKENKIFKFLNCQPSLTSAVKKLYINTEKMNNIDGFSKQDINQLITNVPNLQELELNSSLIPLCHLKDIDLPTSLTSITVSSYVFKTTQDVREYIETLSKHRDRIQKFNMIISDGYKDIFESWNMIDFFGSFSKLTELDVGGINSISCLADCLPIIQAIPSLKSFTFKSYSLYHTDINNTVQYNLDTLEKLNFTVTTLLTNTFSFINHNFMGLKEINATFDSYIIRNLNCSTELLKFLDLIYSLDTYCIKFKTNHMFYMHCLSNIVFQTFTQLPEKSQNISRQLCINAKYSTVEKDISHHFQLESNRDYCNRLQRKIKWDIVYTKANMDELFNCVVSLGISNIDVFTFDMSDTPFQSHCFDLFFELLSSLMEPKKVVLIVPRDCIRYNSLKQLGHINRLEIKVDHSSINKPINGDIPISLDLFTNLKTLRLPYCYGIWNAKNNTYSVELPLIKLESLHIDIIPLVFIARNYDNKNFTLIVETDTLCYFYTVSVFSLFTTKISQVEAEDIQNSANIQIYIKIQSIQHLNLYLLTDMYKMFSWLNRYTLSDDKKDSDFITVSSHVLFHE